MFAIPRSYVEEIVGELGEEMDSTQIGGREFITVRGQRIACVGLDEILGLELTCPPEARLYVMIRLVGGDLFGLAVDAIHNHEELVVKPIAPVLMARGFYVGTTQLDDGSPVPMLDVSGVARSAGMIREVKDRSLRKERRHERPDECILVPALLFRGFDGSERAVEMDLVRRIEKLPTDLLRTGADGKAQIVIDGRIVPLVGLGGVIPEGDELNLFRVGDGDGEMGLPLRQHRRLVRIRPGRCRHHRRARRPAPGADRRPSGRAVRRDHLAGGSTGLFGRGSSEMDHSLLLVSICGELAGIDSANHPLGRRARSITPAPRAPPHVAGLAALRSRALTVVDCRGSRIPPLETADSRRRRRRRRIPMR